MPTGSSTAATQFGVQYGSRYARSTFDDVAYDGYSDLVGLDLRRDLTAATTSACTARSCTLGCGRGGVFDGPSTSA